MNERYGQNIPLGLTFAITYEEKIGKEYGTLKKFLREKRFFIILLGAACSLGLVQRAGDSGKFYTAHVQEEDTLPFVAGTSYYQYQWGLKNDGGIRRITSVYHSRESSESYVTPRSEGDYRQKEPSEAAGTETGEAGPGAGADMEDSPSGNMAVSWDVEQQVRESVAGVDIGIESAWAVYEQIPQRRKVTVALIDTGVDITHQELCGSIWMNTDEIPGDGIDNDHNGYIDDINGWNFYSGTSQIFGGTEDDHGTHGAGTIAGAWDGQGISGIGDSNYVKIMVLKVLGSQDGKGVSTGVKRAIRYAEDNGADICNLSMGTLSYDEELDHMIRDSSMLFVVSAGNGDAAGQGYDIDDLPMYPACYPYENIITVGNLMFDGTMDESSNYGAVNVDIAAPGTYILGAVPSGYAFMTGTSMAAPMVAGTAALIYSCRTDLSLTKVREAIINTARPMEGLYHKTATGGMLNAYGAITYGRQRTEP